MKVLWDKRHRWGDEVHLAGTSRFARTCTACGLTRSYETIIPRAFIDQLLSQATMPNPYRTLFR